ncbi:MAG TPA: hypothetical protein VMF64_06210 [Steroidobacteraceae bacterium]|nr:hypothetical protein [Steroidobacteraceae bacterium]
MSVHVCRAAGRRVRRRWQRRPRRVRFSTLLLLALPALGRADALSNEIDVFTGSIAAAGAFNVTLHDYYVADSRRTAESSGGPKPDHSLTGGTEWAYGAAPWLELGVYAPIYTLSAGEGYFDGAEIRAMLVTPAGGRRFLYGLNVALELNSAVWDPHRRSLELRPVLSWRYGPWRLSANPIVESDLNGLSGTQFSPAERLDYTMSQCWQIGLEEYAEDTGPIRRPRPLRAQNQRLFAIADVTRGHWTIEPGLGIGLTQGSDRMTLKLLLSRDWP